MELAINMPRIYLTILKGNKMITKTCVICGNECEIDDEIFVNPLIKPDTESAQLYFDLCFL